MLNREGQGLPSSICPLDISRAIINPDELQPFVPPKDETFRESRTGVESIAEGVEKIYGLLNLASRPLLLAGGGIKGLKNRRLLEHLSEIMKIPLVFSMNALGAIAQNIPLIGGLLEYTVTEAQIGVLQNLIC